jgi:ABC-type transport system involved in multi-copper enzyme maturation permease subunit
MEKFNFENMRIILVTSFSPILGYFTPTKGFVFSLVMMFSFNIWAGMRADGVLQSLFVYSLYRHYKAFLP